MPRLPRTKFRTRAQAFGLTLLAHGAAVLVLVELEGRSPRRGDTPQLQYVSIWPDLSRQPETNKAPAQRTNPTPAALGALRLPQKTPVAETTEPPLATDADQTPPSRPPVDWNAAATEAAKRFAQDNDTHKTFSAAPRPQRKSCKPRQFDAQTEALMAERLPQPPDPDPVGPDPKGNCIVVGGSPKCVQKMAVRRRRSLLSTTQLEQKLTGSPPVSSVPSAELCD
jgi:hypothetical protein